MSISVWLSDFLNFVFMNLIILVFLYNFSTPSHSKNFIKSNWTHIKIEFYDWNTYCNVINVHNMDAKQNPATQRQRLNNEYGFQRQLITKSIWHMLCLSQTNTNLFLNISEYNLNFYHYSYTFLSMKLFFNYAIFLCSFYWLLVFWSSFI